MKWLQIDILDTGIGHLKSEGHITYYCITVLLLYYSGHEKLKTIAFTVRKDRARILLGYNVINDHILTNRLCGQTDYNIAKRRWRSTKLYHISIIASKIWTGADCRIVHLLLMYKFQVKL